MTDRPEIMKVKEVQEWLRCSNWLVISLFKRGELAGFWLESEIRIASASVQAYILRQANKVKPQQEKPPARKQRGPRASTMPANYQAICSRFGLD